MRTSTTVCDHCGKVQEIDTADIYSGKAGKEPFWVVSYSSSDYAVKGGYRMLSGGWDLCSACVTLARDALIAAVGEPNHDSWPEGGVVVPSSWRAGNYDE